VTGQDGAYLARRLLAQGHEVFGGVRRTAAPGTWRLEELGVLDKVKLIEFELGDEASIKALLDAARPHEIYNLAGQSLVTASFDQPILTTALNAVAVAHLLEEIRRRYQDARFYQASSSEMFGRAIAAPQNEATAFHPLSPYAVSKVYAHHLTANYR